MRRLQCKEEHGMMANQESPSNFNIGKELRDARERRGQTMTDAASTMHVSYAALSKWEVGMAEPTGLYRKAVEKYIREAGETATQAMAPTTAEDRES